jgi:hypothetical protein
MCTVAATASSSQHGGGRMSRSPRRDLSAWVHTSPVEHSEHLPPRQTQYSASLAVSPACSMSSGATIGGAPTEAGGGGDREKRKGKGDGRETAFQWGPPRGVARILRNVGRGTSAGRRATT